MKKIVIEFRKDIYDFRKVESTAQYNAYRTSMFFWVNLSVGNLYMLPSKKYSEVYTNTTYIEFSDELYNWMTELNVDVKFDTEYMISTHGTEFSLIFENDEHALLFKLTWL